MYINAVIKEWQNEMTTKFKSEQFFINTVVFVGGQAYIAQADSRLQLDTQLYHKYLI
jgi:hypothetical protein